MIQFHQQYNIMLVVDYGLKANIKYFVNTSTLSLADSLLNKAERNMKRETKAYSYEDQVWEAKLKEEMAKKKLQDKDKTDLRHVIIMSWSCDTITCLILQDSITAGKAESETKTDD